MSSAHNIFAVLLLASSGVLQAEERVAAKLRDIPLLYEVDVVVAGGSCAAVAAACAAAEQGAQVALLAPRPYLGDDLCGQQHLWLEEGEAPESELARSLFPDGRVTTPFTVKRALDRAMLKHGIRCLTGCYASDVLVDNQGHASGVAVVNRSGSQAVKAKVVVDGTRHALLARQAGAQFKAFTAGGKAFRFAVVGGELQAGPGLTCRRLDITYRNPVGSKSMVAYPVYDYVAAVSLGDNSYAAFARAEQALRNQVCGAGMKDCSELAVCCPADTLIGERRVEGGWPGAAQCEVGVFRPQGLSRLYVLSESADVSAKAISAMLRPLSFLEVGELVGSAAAREAKAVLSATEARLADGAATVGEPVTVGEPHNVTVLAGSTRVVKAGTRALPVLGDYDVVVVGGGTAGAPAGIAAARSGARTLVVEYLSGLGGVGTAGLIGSYWYGVRGGFTKEIDDANRCKDHWNVSQKAEWLRRELLKAKADVWLNSFGCGALLVKGKVTGVVVVTPFGRGVVRAKTVIDATGNSDIADCAGAETQFGVAPNGMLSVQLAGYPHRNLGDNVNNTCFALVDDTSAVDICHLLMWCRNQEVKASPYDFGQLLDSRERRRIAAEFMLTTPDILNHRSFPDTISQHKSNFDAAAFPTSPMLLVKDMKGPAFEVDLPYRSLLPKGLDGILVTGLGAGAERDAMTLIRMQADVQNQGYAAGLAAAMAAGNGGHTREINVKELQKKLVEKDVLAERVLTDKDSYPLSDSAIEKAVTKVGELGREIKQSRTVEDPSIFSLSVVMAQPEQALPLLRQALKASPEGDKRLTYAKILGILGDKTGATTLESAIERTKTWDKGFGLTSHRESDNTFSELDRLIIALGVSGAPDGLEAIVSKIRQLTPDSELSHVIAVSMALQHFTRPRSAIEPLARLINAPGFAGHALTEAIDQRQGKIGERGMASTKPETNLNAAFKELLVASMLVRCGDGQGVGRGILEQYSRGVEGHFARYAQAVLQAAKE